MTPWACTHTQTATQMQLLLTLSTCIRSASVLCQPALHAPVNSNFLSQCHFIPANNFFGELVLPSLKLKSGGLIAFRQRKRLQSTVGCFFFLPSSVCIVFLSAPLCTPSYVHFSAESFRQSLSMLNWKVILL